MTDVTESKNFTGVGLFFISVQDVTFQEGYPSHL